VVNLPFGGEFAMTEADWLAANDSQPMLAHLRNHGAVGERKLRLFAVACCHRVWHLLTDERSREAAGVAERYADGLASRGELESARRFAEADAAEAEAWYQAALASYGIYYEAQDYWVAAGAVLAAASDTSWGAIARLGEVPTDFGGSMPRLLRDLFGNPFRPAPSLAPAVLAWDKGTVPKLAAAIYEERVFDRLPILADALEDAGCTDAEVLTHCRSGGVHVRGCWVVDLVLGKG
jgi:hypothetical protein